MDSKLCTPDKKQILKSDSLQENPFLTITLQFGLMLLKLALNGYYFYARRDLAERTRAKGKDEGFSEGRAQGKREMEEEMKKQLQEEFDRGYFQAEEDALDQLLTL
ncbi:hypothetical protein RHMOL_Rhmol07G0181500 [Rhododendron molle]|uniref:Uncharacterized protein n=1 Tax=Rhododendron molle TaxID=49168 RepID=A0ACC0N405_RHOML|nr:hypothetical protein RHMOL_Rhmol07G0181500 [Rhododendron molle]